MRFIKKSIAQKLDVILKLPEPLTFETAEKGREIKAEEVIRIDFYLDGERLYDDFLVLPDDMMSEDVIIGAKAM